MGDLNLILADQYSNTVKDGESAFVNTIYDRSATGVGTSVAVDNTGRAFSTIHVDATNKKIIATPSALTAGTETVYLKFRSQDDVTNGKNSEVASATNYDAKSKNSFGEIAEAVLNISNLIHIPIG